MTDPSPKATPSQLPVTVNKPTPYTYDLGLLLSTDPNPLPFTSDRDPAVEEQLATTARDGAQALLNQLLSTCPISSTPDGVLLSLPAIETVLPREKPLPAPHDLTTWQRFAQKKGIKPKTAAQRQKLVYDDAKGDWVPKWGYKGKNKDADADWIVEVDEKKESQGREGRSLKKGPGRLERKEGLRRQARREKGNERRAAGRKK